METEKFCDNEKCVNHVDVPIGTHSFYTPNGTVYREKFLSGTICKMKTFDFCDCCGNAIEMMREKIK